MSVDFLSLPFLYFNKKNGLLLNSQKIKLTIGSRIKQPHRSNVKTAMKILEKKPYLIFNPGSGKKRGIEYSRNILSEWNGQFKIPLTVIPTKSIDDIKSLSAEYYKRENFCIFMGGDGTLSLALQGIAEKNGFSKLRDPLAFLPCGTGNSYLRDFGISNFEEGKSLLFEAVSNNSIRNSDAGIIVSNSKIGSKKNIHEKKKRKEKETTTKKSESRIFCNIVSFGLAADIASLAEKMRFMGSTSYTIATLIKLYSHKMKSYSIQYGKSVSEECLCDFISIANSKYTGGAMLIAPPVNFNDGKLFFMRPSIGNRLDLLALFPKIFTGSHLNHPKVLSRFVTEISIQYENNILFVVDGELEEYQNPEIRVLPGYFPICI